MIDRKTGDVLLETINFAVRSELSREEFLASPLAVGSRISVKNEPHCSFITKPQKIADFPFIITLYFYGSVLTAAELCSDNDKFGTAWNDWSEEKELRRKQFHELWLAENLGDAPYDYEWGAVESLYDARGGASFICVKYRK